MTSRQTKKDTTTRTHTRTHMMRTVAKHRIGLRIGPLSGSILGCWLSYSFVRRSGKGLFRHGLQGHRAIGTVHPPILSMRILSSLEACQCRERFTRNQSECLKTPSVIRLVNVGDVGKVILERRAAEPH